MNSLTFERQTVNRWIRKNTINLCSNPIKGVASKEDIVIFLKKINYKDLSKFEKEVYGNAFSNRLITDIDDVSFLDIKIKVGNIRSARVSEHYNSLSEDAKKSRYINRDTVSTRIGKIKKIHPNWTNEECKRESYIAGLVTKGRRIAISLNMNPHHMTDKELISLTGRTKSENFKNLTDEEKNFKSTEWKRSNLKNEKIRELLTKEIPEFGYLDVMKLSASEVIQFYSAYMSLLSASKIANGRVQRGSRYKHGYYFSSKNQKRHYYRSSYELLCYQLLDSNERIISYITEPYHIKFFDALGNYEFSYVPDIVAKLANNDTVIFEPKGEFNFDDFMIKKGNRILLDFTNVYFLQKKQITEEYINDIIDRHSIHK